MCNADRAGMELLGREGVFEKMSRSNVTGREVVNVRIRVAPLPVSTTLAPAAAPDGGPLLPPLRSGKIVNPPEGAA